MHSEEFPFKSGCCVRRILRSQPCTNKRMFQQFRDGKCAQNVSDVVVGCVLRSVGFCGLRICLTVSFHQAQ